MIEIALTNEERDLIYDILAEQYKKYVDNMIAAAKNVDLDRVVSIIDKIKTIKIVMQEFYGD